MGPKAECGSVGIYSDVWGCSSIAVICPSKAPHSRTTLGIHARDARA
jgi:hypothetical protein